MSDRPAVVRKNARFRTIFALFAMTVLAASSAGLGVVGVASLMGGVGPNAPSGKGTDAPPIATKAAGTSALARSLAGMARTWDGWSVHQRALALAGIVADSPAKIAATVGNGMTLAQASAYRSYFAAHPEAILSPMDLGGLENGLVAAGVGCVVGGAVGLFVGGPVGAGVGCAVGAVGGLLLQDYLRNSAGGIGLRQEDAIVRAQQTAFSNYQNITAAQFTDYLSGWNSTLFAWENAADAAAVSQIGNSTFDYRQDIAMSYVGYQFNAMSYPAIAQTGAALAQTNRVMYSIYSSPGLTNTHDYLVWDNGACFGGGTCSPQWYGGAGVFSTISGGTAGTLVSVLKNATFSVGCSGGQFGNLVDAVTGKAVLTFNNNTSAVGNTIVSNFTGKSGAYVLYGSMTATTGCSVTGNGVLALPSSPLAGNVGTSMLALLCGHTKVPGTCNPLLHPIVVGSQPDGVQSVNSTGPFNLQPHYAFLGGSMLPGNWGHQFSVMMESVESNAYTYWSFLRALGYTSVSQIPSDCIIPFPDVATPSFNANNQAVSVNDTEALYGAMLNSLATFFNVAPGTSTFCKGHAVFTYGEQAGPILGQNITGFVLTLPIGTHQKWKSQFTFALNGSNPGIANRSIPGATNKTPIGLVLWPTTLTVRIPLGVVVQVASNNPIDAMVSQTFQQYAFYGNGSRQTDGGTLGTAVTSSSPGVALYLTQCIINQIAENPCVLNYTTITDSVGNISCFPDCNSGQGITIPSGGGACGTTVPVLGTIVNAVAGAVSGIPIIGGLGCDVGWLVAFIVVLVVVIVVVWVAAAIFRRS